jgi:hypothetical protein
MRMPKLFGASLKVEHLFIIGSIVVLSEEVQLILVAQLKLVRKKKLSPSILVLVKVDIMSLQTPKFNWQDANNLHHMVIINSHVPMLSIQAGQSSHTLIEGSVCGGEHNLEEITGLVRLKSEIEETAVEVDLLTQKYLLEVKVAVRLKKELKMDNGIL